MRAKELVPILSERFGIQQVTGAVIDRSLASGGLRGRGLGRSWPEMTRYEAITFMLACLVTEKPTKAAEEVGPWVVAKAKVNQEPVCIDETNRTRTKPYDPEAWEDEETPHDELPRVQFCRRIESYFLDKRDTRGNVGLVVYLGVVCSLIELNVMTPERVKLDVVRSRRHARLTYADEEGTTLLDDTFDVLFAPKPSPIVTEAAIMLTASVNGYALTEILLRTSADETMAEVD